MNKKYWSYLNQLLDEAQDLSSELPLSIPIMLVIFPMMIIAMVWILLKRAFK